MPARKWMAVVALVAVGATACGSASKSSSATSTSSGSPSASTAASPTTGPSTSHGSGGGSFCSLARQFESAAPNRSIGTKTPADLKAIYQQLPRELQQVEAAAPSAIKGDFATLVNAEDQIVSAFAKANYDFTKISAATFAGLDTAQVRASSARISQYMAQTCGTSTPAT
jgi:hypothetical protein